MTRCEVTCNASRRFAARSGPFPGRHRGGEQTHQEVHDLTHTGEQL